MSKKLAKGVFLYGNYAKDILIKWGIPAEKMFTIYNSLSYDEQLPLRKSIQPSAIYGDHFHNDNDNIVFIGRLTAVKKLDQILRAVKILKDKGVQYNVTFIGDGNVRGKLETMTSELGLQDSVWFYGALYDERKIAEFLYNADLCVSPGNVGLTAMHAMAFGCPVISHDNFPRQMPEFEAIEVGKTGNFFKENDVDSLAQAILDWKENSGDRSTVRENCYKVIDEKYNPHVQIEVIKKAIYQ
ncbi:MAG: glycosyltransferase family 4 protein [Bacteroidales bacterium]|nr:glycosyltransferase family 4 protein [Bacteroidales bacterium]